MVSSRISSAVQHVSSPPVSMPFISREMRLPSCFQAKVQTRPSPSSSVPTIPPTMTSPASSSPTNTRNAGRFSKFLRRHDVPSGATSCEVFLIRSKITSSPHTPSAPTSTPSRIWFLRSYAHKHGDLTPWGGTKSRTAVPGCHGSY
jgi:hypothetical protein